MYVQLKALAYCGLHTLENVQSAKADRRNPPQKIKQPQTGSVQLCTDSQAATLAQKGHAGPLLQSCMPAKGAKCADEHATLQL